MAIDFDAIRRKLDQLSGNNRKRDQLWRPSEGETATVRLVAFPDNEGQPFKERWFYYNIGNNPGLLSPYQFNQPDPIQELINSLREDGKKESYELAKKLYPKMRTYALVLVRGEEDKGLRIWSFGKMVYQSLLNIMLDEDYGDITDPTTGRDIKVQCTKQPGRKWATTEVIPRGSPSKLCGSAKEVKALVSEIPDLDQIYSCKTYEELEKIVNDWLNDDEGDNSENFNYSSDSTLKSNTANSNFKSGNKYKDLDDAFADLKDF